MACVHADVGCAGVLLASMASALTVERLDEGDQLYSRNLNSIPQLFLSGCWAPHVPPGGSCDRVLGALAGHCLLSPGNQVRSIVLSLRGPAVCSSI